MDFFRFWKSCSTCAFIPIQLHLTFRTFLQHYFLKFILNVWMFVFIIVFFFQPFAIHKQRDCGFVFGVCLEGEKTWSKRFAFFVCSQQRLRKGKLSLFCFLLLLVVVLGLFLPGFLFFVWFFFLWFFFSSQVGLTVSVINFRPVVAVLKMFFLFVCCWLTDCSLVRHLSCPV